MSDDDAVARSPITPAEPVLVVAGWEVSGCHTSADLRITDCTPLAKVQVRAPWNGAMAKALGVSFGRTGRDAGTLVTGSGPGEWLVLAPPGTAREVAGKLESLAAGSAPEEFVTVTDLTHGRALVRITGHRAAGLLGHLCGIDLDDSFTPDGAALRTSVAGVATDVIRDDRDGVQSYLLHCERSSGAYLFGMLTAAGEAYGIGVEGFTLPGI